MFLSFGERCKEYLNPECLFFLFWQYLVGSRVVVHSTVIRCISAVLYLYLPRRSITCTAVSSLVCLSVYLVLKALCNADAYLFSLWLYLYFICVMVCSCIWLLMFMDACVLSHLCFRIFSGLRAPFFSKPFIRLVPVINFVVVHSPRLMSKLTSMLARSPKPLAWRMRPGNRPRSCWWVRGREARRALPTPFREFLVLISVLRWASADWL